MSSAAPAGSGLADRLFRPLRQLRLSVTDRCNLRCAYCMPEQDYAWLPADDLLSFEEQARLVSVFAGLGVEGVRLTGGEPLLRRDLPSLVSLLRAAAPSLDLSLTTNGVLLEKSVEPLERAGLNRLNVSLDTLLEDRFQALTRRRGVAQVLAGIERAALSGLRPLKLDTVVVRGVNDDELVPLLDYATTVGAELRFIEYMDVGGATGWSSKLVVRRDELLSALSLTEGHPEPLLEDPSKPSRPAQRFRLPDGRVFGIIASTSAPFCGRCDRARLTANGELLTCLYAERGTSLKAPLREGASDDALAALIALTWEARADRGAETRRALGERRAPLVSRRSLQEDPLLEMHARGG